jgi:hypothetical protein
MLLQSVAHFPPAATEPDRDYFRESDSDQATGRTDVTIAKLKQSGNCRFLLLQLPEMAMIGKLLLTHEKAPVRLMLSVNVLKGYEGSYRISFGNGRTASIEISTVENVKSQIELEEEWPCMGIIESSIPGIVVNTSGVDCCSQIIVRPDQPWLQAFEEYHVFELDIAEMLCVKDSDAENEMSFAIAVMR